MGGVICRFTGVVGQPASLPCIFPRVLPPFLSNDNNYVCVLAEHPLCVLGPELQGGKLKSIQATSFYGGGVGMEAAAEVQ